MHSSPATWLIVEPVFVGHRFTYLLEIVRGALTRDLHVIVAVADDAQGDKIAAHLGSSLASHAVTIIRVQAPHHRVRLPGPLGLLQRAVGWRKFLSRSYQQARKHGHVDFAFVPYLDDALFAVSILGSPFGDTPFSGVTMRQRFHLREMGVNAHTSGRLGAKRRLFLRLLRLEQLRSTYVIDDTLQAYVERKYPQLAGKVRFIADPIAPAVAIPRAKAREALGLPSDAAIILAYGYMDARKGVARLLRWAALRDTAPTVLVLIAGTMSPDVEQLMAGESALGLRAQGRLQMFNRYIEMEEERLLFSAADVVWLGYEDIELMSGVLVTAAHFHKAILFTDYGLIGAYAVRFGTAQGSRQSPIDASRLPEGIHVRFFDGTSGAAALPDHTWKNACRAIFDA